VGREGRSGLVEMCQADETSKPCVYCMIIIVKVVRGARESNAAAEIKTYVLRESSAGIITKGYNITPV